VVHGLGLGTFLLAFGRPRQGIVERTPRLLIGSVVMAIVAWLTVWSGTFIAYPWYRAVPPEGLDRAVQSDALKDFPRYWLLASEKTAEWHRFGMEWKEHVAWIAPFLSTAVAFAVLYYGARRDPPGGDHLHLTSRRRGERAPRSESGNGTCRPSKWSRGRGVRRRGIGSLVWGSRGPQRGFRTSAFLVRRQLGSDRRGPAVGQGRLATIASWLWAVGAREE
jgi:hypothetical protein